jgi:hypothetical protein
MNPNSELLCICGHELEKHWGDEGQSWCQESCICPFYSTTCTAFKGTTGPYHLRGINSVAVDDAECSVIVYFDSFRKRSECIANARLYAASWDLLKAAQEILHWYEEDSSEFNRDTAIENIRRAVVKAVSA